MEAGGAVRGGIGGFLSRIPFSRPSPDAPLEELQFAVVFRTTAAFAIANMVGAVLAFAAVGFILPLFVDQDDWRRLGTINGSLLVPGVVIGQFIGNRVGRRYSLPIRVWLSEDRPPTDTERRDALLLPIRSVRLNAGLWFFSSIVFGIVNVFLASPALGLLMFGVIVFGGLTTSALVYLLIERELRPLTARALAGSRPGAIGLSVTRRLFTVYALGTAIPLLGIVMVAIVALVKSDVDATFVGSAALFLSVSALFTGLRITMLTAGSIADPIRSVRRGMAKVEEGDFDATVDVEDASEIGFLQAGFNQMAEGLREREQIRDVFGRQVGREVAQSALDGEVVLGGEEREIAALFVDLSGSTSMALQMEPTEVVRRLNSFFGIVVEVAERHGGFVNKFEGDAALCVFGAPGDLEDPAGKALCGARELAPELHRRVPEIRFGIGVSAGRAVAGNIGAEARFEYTVIGDPVNEASRLCDLAKHRGVPTLASEAAVIRANSEERELWQLGEEVTLRGRNRPTVIAEPS